MADPADPRARFQRIILPRVGKAIKAIELVGNGATRDYQTDAWEVGDLLAGLTGAVQAVETRYAEHLGTGVPDGPAETAAEAPATPPALPLPPAGDEAWRAAMEAVSRMNPHRVAMLADAIDPAQIAPLMTQLLARLAEMAAAKPETASHA